jgi:hypothetical protein
MMGIHSKISKIVGTIVTKKEESRIQTDNPLNTNSLFLWDLAFYHIP